MNKTIQERINRALSYMRLSNRGHLNCIRLNSSCSKEHNQKIIDICLELLNTKTQFYTEAIFKDNQRCDIFIPAMFEIVEVLKTETEKKFNLKHYPDVFSIRKVRI